MKAVMFSRGTHGIWASCYDFAGTFLCGPVKRLIHAFLRQSHLVQLIGSTQTGRAWHAIPFKCKAAGDFHDRRNKP